MDKKLVFVPVWWSKIASIRSKTKSKCLGVSRGGIFASAAVDDSLPALIIEKACNLSVTNNVISALSEISSYLSQWQWHTYWHRISIQKLNKKVIFEGAILLSKDWVTYGILIVVATENVCALSDACVWHVCTLASFPRLHLRGARPWRPAPLLTPPGGFSQWISLF